MHLRAVASFSLTKRLTHQGKGRCHSAQWSFMFIDGTLQLSLPLAGAAKLLRERGVKSIGHELGLVPKLTNTKQATCS